jgi:phospholipid-translocating ATPase
MSSLFRRQNANDADTDEEDDSADVDPDLRLRTVQTAASTIAESIRSEQRMHRRRTKRRKLWGSKMSLNKKPPSNSGHESVVQEAATAATPASANGSRKNIYINMPLGPNDVDRQGRPINKYVRNKVRTTSTYFSEFPDPISTSSLCIR